MKYNIHALEIETAILVWFDKNLKNYLNFNTVILNLQRLVSWELHYAWFLIIYLLLLKSRMMKSIWLTRVVPDHCPMVRTVHFLLIIQDGISWWSVNRIHETESIPGFVWNEKKKKRAFIKRGVNRFVKILKSLKKLNYFNSILTKSCQILYYR